MVNRRRLADRRGHVVITFGQGVKPANLFVNQVFSGFWSMFVPWDKTRCLPTHSLSERPAND